MSPEDKQARPLDDLEVGVSHGTARIVYSTMLVWSTERSDFAIGRRASSSNDGGQGQRASPQDLRSLSSPGLSSNLAWCRQGRTGPRKRDRIHGARGSVTAQQRGSATTRRGHTRPRSPLSTTIRPDHDPPTTTAISHAASGGHAPTRTACIGAHAVP
jgi:hypothetical protein